MVILNVVETSFSWLIISNRKIRVFIGDGQVLSQV